MEARVLLRLAALLYIAYLLLKTEAAPASVLSDFGRHHPTTWRAYSWEHRRSWLSRSVEYMGELLRNTVPLAAIAAFTVTSALLGVLCFLTYIASD